MQNFAGILEHVPAALLVVFRIGGLMLYGPVFGAPVIPARVKSMLALVVGLSVYPALSRQGFVDVDLHLDLYSLAPIVAMELLIGLFIGFVASLPLVSVQAGGLVMGQQMGLGFARFYNPGIDDEADVIGQVLFFMALAGFLVIGGHDAMLLAVLRSFEHVPLGAFVIDSSVIELITGLLLASFELALRVAAPVLAIVFLQSVAMGYTAKTVPQLNILSLGFPLRILVGVTFVMCGLVVIQEVVMEGVDEGMARLFEWLER
ncbi:MAG: flagellar biosynthetic protein FliR [Planctomycetes bacterium]|nr:flagellar biosynthetic protein FliR [Planctomycetota bacterium]